jgi:hypothetical protein
MKSRYLHSQVTLHWCVAPAAGLPPRQWKSPARASCCEKACIRRNDSTQQRRTRLARHGRRGRSAINGRWWRTNRAAHLALLRTAQDLSSCPTATTGRFPLPAAHETVHIEVYFASPCECSVAVKGAELTRDGAGVPVPASDGVEMAGCSGCGASRRRG